MRPVCDICQINNAVKIKISLCFKCTNITKKKEFRSDLNWWNSLSSYIIMYSSSIKAKLLNWGQKCKCQPGVKFQVYKSTPSASRLLCWSCEQMKSPSGSNRSLLRWWYLYFLNSLIPYLGPGKLGLGVTKFPTFILWLPEHKPSMFII